MFYKTCRFKISVLEFLDFPENWHLLRPKTHKYKLVLLNVCFCVHGMLFCNFQNKQSGQFFRQFQMKNETKLAKLHQAWQYHKTPFKKHAYCF